MNNNLLLKEIEEEIEIRCNLIAKAKENDSMLYHYYGTSAIIEMLKSVRILSDEQYKKYDKMIESAHNKYYEIIKEDLKSVHKRLS